MKLYWKSPHKLFCMLDYCFYLTLCSFYFLNQVKLTRVHIKSGINVDEKLEKKLSLISAMLNPLFVFSS